MVPNTSTQQTDTDHLPRQCRGRLEMHWTAVSLGAVAHEHASPLLALAHHSCVCSVGLRLLQWFASIPAVVTSCLARAADDRSSWGNSASKPHSQSGNQSKQSAQHSRLPESFRHRHGHSLYQWQWELLQWRGKTKHWQLMSYIGLYPHIYSYPTKRGVKCRWGTLKSTIVDQHLATS